MRRPSALAVWPARRWTVAATLAVVLSLGQHLAMPDGASRPGWWWPATVATSALAAMVFASYVPIRGSGRLVEGGCTPCATLAGGLATFAVAGGVGRVDVGGSLLGLLLVVVAIGRRLSDAGTCQAAPGPRPDAAGRCAHAPRQHVPTPVQEEQ